MTSVDDVIRGTARWHPIVGDARHAMRVIPDGTCRIAVTSPPYYLVRDYEMDGQIGQEATPEEYVEAIVGVMGEVRRCLSDDGTLWLNLGDSYNSGSSGGLGKSGLSGGKKHQERSNRSRKKGVYKGLPAKNLFGIPWAVAFAMRSAGWYLRAEIIVEKLNPVPENVDDRPTRSHETLFLFSKRGRYFYDADAIAERGANGEMRNARDVWPFASDGYEGAHFATMVPALARRCIAAGSKRGDIVLDPFGGAATTALEALRAGRRSIICELNPGYVDLQRERLAVFDADAVSPVPVDANADFGPLFLTRK